MNKSKEEKCRYYLIDSENNPEGPSFVSKRPRGAAMKAATRGHESIRLFDGKGMIWIFKGSRTETPKRGRMPWAWDLKLYKGQAEFLNGEEINEKQSDSLLKICQKSWDTYEAGRKDKAGKKS